MPWIVRLFRNAERQVEQLPADQAALVRRHLREMAEDPFAGDVKPLKGKKWKGFYRKRTGRYRIIFFPKHSERVIEISAILLRSEKTYR